MKKIFLSAFVVAITGLCAYSATGPFGYDLNADINRSKIKQQQEAQQAQQAQQAPQGQQRGGNVQQQNEPKGYTPSYSGEAEWEKDTNNYYPDANLNSAINKYKKGNFSGCLQEMISLTKKDPSNPLVYYYMGMSYAQVGNKESATRAYDQVLKLNASEALIEYATKGRDCLIGGPACQDEAPVQVQNTGVAVEGEDAALDEFINAPYGNGLSPEVNKQIREKEIQKIQQKINNKDNLSPKDFEKLHEYENESSIEDETKVAVSNDEVLEALETLKKAGLTLNVTPAQMPYNDEYAQLSMLLGNNNNNNNNFMNMLPYFMAQEQNGKNIDPQILQSMMMNSMLPNFTFDNDKKY